MVWGLPAREGLSDGSYWSDSAGAGVVGVFIPTEDEFVKDITVKRICPNIQLLLLLLKAWRFKKPLRNGSGPQGRSDQSGGGLRREWRMEAAELEIWFMCRDGWWCGGGGGAVGE